MREVCFLVVVRSGDRKISYFAYFYTVEHCSLLIDILFALLSLCVHHLEFMLVSLCFVLLQGAVQVFLLADELMSSFKTILLGTCRCKNTLVQFYVI